MGEIVEGRNYEAGPVTPEREDAVEARLREALDAESALPESFAEKMRRYEGCAMRVFNMDRTVWGTGLTIQETLWLIRTLRETREENLKFRDIIRRVFVEAVHVAAGLPPDTEEGEG